jgi:hypothetical protein
MTFRSPLMFRPHPAMVAPALPMMVLFERTRSMPEQEIVPDTRMTAGALAPTAAVRADALLTVVVAAEPPPVVPPFRVAQPTRSRTPSGRGAAVVVAACATPDHPAGQDQREREHRNASGRPQQAVGHISSLPMMASARAGRRWCLFDGTIRSPPIDAVVRGGAEAVDECSGRVDPARNAAAWLQGSIGRTRWEGVRVCRLFAFPDARKQ